MTEPRVGAEGKKVRIMQAAVESGKTPGAVAAPMSPPTLEAPRR